MNLQRKRLIDAMIEKAVKEQIEHVAFRNPGYRDVLANCISTIADGAADRITGDLGRERRITQLFQMKKR